MKEFFEIHDSTLKEIVETEHGLTFIIDAIRIEWPTAEMDVDGNTFTQLIQLDFEGIAISRDSPIPPETLLDGSFNAEWHEANQDDKLDGYVIPASLRSAEGVRLVLQGMTKNWEDYVTLEIAAKSMRLIVLAAPQFLDKIPAN
jgi:hypothetical protein